MYLFVFKFSFLFFQHLLSFVFFLVILFFIFLVSFFFMYVFFFLVFVSNIVHVLFFPFFLKKSFFFCFSFFFLPFFVALRRPENWLTSRGQKKDRFLLSKIVLGRQVPFRTFQDIFEIFLFSSFFVFLFFF